MTFCWFKVWRNRYEGWRPEASHCTSTVLPRRARTCSFSIHTCLAFVKNKMRLHRVASELFRLLELLCGFHLFTTSSTRYYRFKNSPSVPSGDRRPQNSEVCASLPLPSPCPRQSRCNSTTARRTHGQKITDRGTPSAIHVRNLANTPTKTPRTAAPCARTNRSGPGGSRRRGGRYRPPC